MSFEKGEKPLDHFKKSSQDFNKSSTCRALISSRYRSTKEIVTDTEKPTSKKPTFQLNLSPKAEFLTARSPVSSRFVQPVEDHSPINKLNTDRIRSLSGSFPKPSPRVPTKFQIRMPQDSPKFNVNILQGPKLGSHKYSESLSLHNDSNSLKSPKMARNPSLPNAEPMQFSKGPNGAIQAFAACTNQGIIRDYNEDRILIYLNAPKPANKEIHDNWPNCNILGVMDGHGGSKCADFLKENIHHYIIRSKYFPRNPHEALKEACEAIDKEYIDRVLAEMDEFEKKPDRSGSCAIILLMIDDNCYICNVGDSRAVLSQNKGDIKFALTRDHKPNDKMEHKRITEAGGTIYQNFPLGPNGKRIDMDPAFSNFNIGMVPFRINPGRLSVSRAFGDIEAKLTKFGGNPNVLISKPEVTTLKINSDYDFIVLGCDGIYDVLSDDEVVSTIWKSLNAKKTKNIHEAVKLAAEELIKETMARKSQDNVTAIIVCFSNLGYKTAFNFNEVMNAKVMQQTTVKVSQRWEYFQMENEPSPPKSFADRPQSKQFKNKPSLDYRSEYTSDESKPKTPTPKRGYNFVKSLPFEKLSLALSKNESVQRKTSSVFPKISAIRTPR